MDFGLQDYIHNKPFWILHFQLDRASKLRVSIKNLSRASKQKRKRRKQVKIRPQFYVNLKGCLCILKVQSMPMSCQQV